jgi:Tol biopolymer transport system component
MRVSGPEVAQVAWLDTETKEVMNTCFDIHYYSQPSTPIWSPDGKQFLVVDRYDENHQKVLLFDRVSGDVLEIAGDGEPVGWLLHP